MPGDKDTLNTQPVCMHCGISISDNRYIKKSEIAYCCENCYFKNTYLDGVVGNIEATYLATLEAFVSAIDAREREMGDHSLRVSRFSLILGHAHGIQGRALVDLYCGSLLHDIGKIGVPDAVLQKQGPLAPEEQEIMRRHPEIGHRIIKHIGYLSRAADIAWSHHEHYDGSGYPRGLKGGEIPLEARVFAVADALDALTVKRPYREPLRFDEAAREIGSASGKVYDPAVVETFGRSSGELRGFIGVSMDRLGETK